MKEAGIAAGEWKASRSKIERARASECASDRDSERGRERACAGGRASESEISNLKELVCSG